MSLSYYQSEQNFLAFTSYMTHSVDTWSALIIKGKHLLFFIGTCFTDHDFLDKHYVIFCLTGKFSLAASAPVFRHVLLVSTAKRQPHLFVISVRNPFNLFIKSSENLIKTWYENFTTDQQ